MKGEYVISDGGVSMPIPVEAITDHCDFSLAMDISNYVVKPMKKINIFEILKRSEMITSLRLKRELSKKQILQYAQIHLVFIGLILKSLMN